MVPIVWPYAAPAARAMGALGIGVATMATVISRMMTVGPHAPAAFTQAETRSPLRLSTSPESGPRNSAATAAISTVATAIFTMVRTGMPCANKRASFQIKYKKERGGEQVEDDAEGDVPFRHGRAERPVVVQQVPDGMRRQPERQRERGPQQAGQRHDGVEDGDAKLHPEDPCGTVGRAEADIGPPD